MDKFSADYKIRNYNVDLKDNLKVTQIFDFCQDMAEEHALRYDLGYDFCCQHGIGWVLTNFHVKIKSLPHMGETLNITTWPSKVRKLASRREFVFKVNNEVCVNASTQWVLMDLSTYKLQSIPQFFPQLDVIDEFVTEDEFSKINLPENMKFQKSFEASYNTIDVFKHVNNSIYPLWACEAMGFDWQMEKQLKEIEIQFKNQTFPTSLVDVYANIENNNVIQSIYKKDEQENNIEVARIKTIWE